MKIKIAIIISLVFFVFGLSTLTDYGINWDTINHLPRGQAYLHYFLTGKKDYSDLPDFQKYFQNPDTLSIDANVPKSEVPTRSMYQSYAATFTYFMHTDGDGHPPLSDILSSVFNRVLFGKLRIVNDIDSYRIYGLVLAALLVGLVFYWAASEYGLLAGLVSSLSLALYPLFWSESHFNTEKDIPETVFWSFFIFSIWKGIKEKKWQWILSSGVFFGLALGTKFNILFSAVVIIPWLIIATPKIFKNWWFIISALLAAIIGFAIFFGSWPYLWADPITRIGGVLSFYREIGTSPTGLNPKFIGPFGINTYSIKWILYTTPPVILLFSSLGGLLSLDKLFKEKNRTFLLLLFWFFGAGCKGLSSWGDYLWRSKTINGICSSSCHDSWDRC